MSPGIRRQRLSYFVWRSMIQRCDNKNHKAFKWYGARGIKVCEYWMKYENFLTDMGESPAGLSLDRVENDKGYFKENCRWADEKTQKRNRRGNKVVTFNGKSACLSEWSEITNIPRSTLKTRLNSGWSVEKTLTTKSMTGYERAMVRWG